MEAVIAGFSSAFDPFNIAFIVLGVTLGITVGAIPGFSAPMAVAIGVPLTYAMNPVSAIAFLLGIHKGGEYGGAITSILINTPGEVSSALTALEGYPLARQGKPRKALMMSLYASVSGDVLADLVLIVSAAPLAVLALRMGPPELLGVLIFSFAFISGFLGRSLLKGIVALSAGMLLATIGLDIETGSERFTFGILELQDGLPMVAIAIGVLVLGEVLYQIEEYFHDVRAKHQEQRVEHVSCNLCKARIGRQCRLLRLLVGNLVANTDNQDPVRAEMDSRTQRCRLPHRTITVVLVADQHRRKNHWHRDARHDVIEMHFPTNTDAACPVPGRLCFVCLEEGM